jgi:cell shape-determining protein MreC
MRDRRATDGISLRGPIAGCVLAVVALSLGTSAESALRSLVRDIARPGYVLGTVVSRHLAGCDLQRWPWTAGDTTVRKQAPSDETVDRLAKANRERRALRAELAAARRELVAYERSLGPERRSSTSSDGVQRIPARVLRAADDTDGQTVAGGVLLGSGSENGIAPDQISVEPIVLTAGTATATPEGAIVIAGAAVVGRTDEVGRWTSTLLPVTDAGFRAHVRLVRETESGPVAGDEGILEGDGRRGCLVRYVPSTSSVAVGDHVYSFDPTGRLSQPLYYGCVVAAELRDGAPHWTITVEPAADVASFTTIHVLAPTNPDPSHPVTLAE